MTSFDLQQLARVPSELTERAQWVVWKHAAKGAAGKLTKIPFDAGSGAAAATDNPATFVPYAVALEVYADRPDAWSGIGFVFTADDPFVGIDLDNSLDEHGQLLPWAKPYLSRIGATYAEVSPSGRGVKIWARGQLDGKGVKFRPFGEERPEQIEIYDRLRFFTVTGRRFGNAPFRANDCCESVARMYREIRSLQADAPRSAPTVKTPEPKEPTPGDRAARCMAYLDRCPEALTGQRGHDKTFRAACECVRFDLDDGQTWAVMRWWNDFKSDEKWNDAELLHKINTAQKEASSERGCRLKEDRQQAKGVKDSAAPATPPRGATAELVEYFEAVADGRIRSASFPWPVLTKFTQALLPGTVTVIAGDPGVGKTFFVLQCLQHWIANDVPSSVFFIEKNRRFHTQRLLCQLEANPRYVNQPWLENPANRPDWEAAISRHSITLERLGRNIFSEPKGRVTLPSLLGWVTQQASRGQRVILIDPVSAAATGPQRWTEDEDFMLGVQAAASSHGCSVVLVTHARKGNRVGGASGHDMAGGAAYFKYADTTIWMHQPKVPKAVYYFTPHGQTSGMIPHFFQLHKTRNGRGQNLELAYIFRDMLYAEQGIVLGEVGKKDRIAPPPDGEAA